MIDTCFKPRPRAADPAIKWVHRSIQSGRFAAGQPLCTELDLVRRFKVSRATIRRALDEQEQQGVIERRAGRGIFVRRASATAKRMIQVLVPSLDNDFGIGVARAAQRRGQELGGDVMVYDAHFSLERDIDAIARLPREQFDGAIIVSVHHPRVSEMFLKLWSAKFPFVVVDHRPDIDVPTVEADNYKGAYAAGKELVRRGHRRIAYIGPVLPSTRFRLEGLRDAINDSGIVFDRNLIGDLGMPDLTVDSREAVKRCVSKVLVETNSPATALVVHRTSDLAFVYQVLRSLGKTIGRDISVVAFGDSAGVAVLEPKPTLVGLSFAAIGAAAMELMSQRIENAGGATEHRVIPTEWIEGESVATVTRGFDDVISSFK